MKKFLVLVFFFSFLSLGIHSVVYAQDNTGLPAPVEENTVPVLPQSEEDLPEEGSSDKDGMLITEENQQSFTNGLLVGGIVGLVVGVLAMWIFKKRTQEVSE